MKLSTRMLNHYLIERGLDQQQLAKIAEVSEPTITRMKRGEKFTSDTLGKLALALGCNPIDLLDTTGYVSPHLGASSFAISAR